MKPPFKVICIDASDSWGKFHLMQDKEYEVKGVDGPNENRDEPFYRIASKKGVMIWTRSSRFRMIGQTAKAASHSLPKDERQAEIAFFRDSQPGYCPCGIARQQCNYHR